MQSPGRLPLYADRWVPFTRTLQIEGKDLTGASFAMQVRPNPVPKGAALISLGKTTNPNAQGVRLIYGGTDTIANHIAADRIDEAPEGMSEADSLALSLIGIRINETTMEGLPADNGFGGDVTFHWDIHITPVGELKDRWLYGPFIVRAGVTV